MYRIIPNKSQEQWIELPSSKSITHRLLILAALNSGKTKILKPLISEDTEITITALQRLGAQIEARDSSLAITHPIGQALKSEIYLGNSGSSARFLLPLGVYADKPIRFSGSERLHKRPFSQLLAALSTFGHKFESTNQSLPVITFPGSSKGGKIRLKELPSSQIVTGLMMAGLKMQKNLTIEIPRTTPSLPYIIMTINLMKRLRLDVDYTNNTIRVNAKQPNADWMLTVEKDFSAASYWVVYALINRVKVVLKNMNVPSLQGDQFVLDIAEKTGADIMLYTDRIEINGEIKHAFDVDCESTPDLVPALSILALFCPSKCRLRNVKLLEYKESNRIQAVRENLEKIGGRSEFSQGNLTIIPRKSYRGTRINSYNDHRIAMSFAVAGTQIPGIIIDDPGCVAKSYPGFWMDFTYWKKEKG